MAISRNAQTWSAERYARNAGFVSDLGAPLIDLLAPQVGEAILDLGCGDGELALRLVDAGACVVAVDAGPDMVAAARARGLDARVVDGQALTFRHDFDAVFSNAALHWMRRPDDVIAGVRRALKPGGRFVAEFGGDGNVRRIQQAMIDALDRRGFDGAGCSPWYFPSSADYRSRLEAQGFSVASIELIPRPTPLPGDIGDWLDTFCEPFLFAVPGAERAALKGEIVEAVRPELFDPDHGWWVDYVRLRVAARVP